MGVDPLALLPQGGDDIAQGEEAKVDVDALLQPVPLCIGLLLSLRAGQIHHMKLNVKVNKPKVGTSNSSSDIRIVPYRTKKKIKTIVLD